MSRSKKAKPSKPMTAAERRAKDFARVDLQPEAAALPANADVHVEQAERPDAASGKKGNVERARRMDAFSALREGMQVGAYDAARKLERDIIISRGEHDHGRPVERVQGDEASARGRVDQIVAASERVRKVLEMIGDRDAWLLRELIAPSNATKLRCDTWRSVVQYITGETFAHGQAAAVRGACANLLGGYQRLERECRRLAA